MLVDLRYAIRALRNSPGFTLVAAVTLAVGIGAVTAAFSLAHWLLLRPVPGISEPNRLAVVWFVLSRSPSPLAAAAGVQPTFVSYAQYQDMIGRLPALAGLAGYHRGAVNLGAAGTQPRRVNVHYVMPQYFAVLGLRPALGRPLLAEDDVAPQGMPAAVISDELWSGLFGRDRSAVGKSVIVDGRPFTVVGVAPPGFRGIERMERTDLWLPGRVMETARLGGYYEFLARLVPGATFAQAEAQLHAGVAALGEDRDVQVFHGVGVPPLQRRQVEQFVRLTFIASILVWVISCANVANLFLFRGLARRPVTAMLKVLGAHTGAVIRRQFTESLVLTVPALLAGILLARWFVMAFNGARLGMWIEPLEGISLVWPVVALGCVVAVAAALLAAIAPSVMASRMDPREAVQATARTLTGGTAYLRRTLTVTQLALSLTLLVGALLLLGTLRRLNAIDPGFDPRGVLVLNVTPNEADFRNPFQTPRLRTYYRELRDRLQSAGLGQVALAWQAPFVGLISVGFVLPPGASSDSARVRVRENAVSPEYFRLLNLPMIEGRGFTSAEFMPDPSAPRKIILSQSVARRLFGDRPAVGHVIYESVGEPPYQVVGVVGDTRWESLEPSFPVVEGMGMMVYSPFGQGGLAVAVVLTRSPLPDKVAAETVERVAGEVDPSLPAYGVTSMPQLIQRTLADKILYARVLWLLSALAVALAAVGLYGLVAYGVASHTREFGIRIALGAESRAILLLVLREAALLGVGGVALGLAGAVALSRLIANRLYGMSALDPGTYLVAVALLFGIALLASYLPARAATRVDPLVALRTE
jgi:putative ABC transport system permease protein